MKKYKIRIIGNNDFLFEQNHENISEVIIPKKWGLINAGWYTEEALDEEGIDIEDSLETRDVLNENNQVIRTEYRMAKSYEIIEQDPETDPAVIKQKEIEDKIKLGANDRMCSQEVWDLIAGYNRSRELTVEQIDQMQTLFTPVVLSLLNKRPDTAKALISAINPDGTLVTTEMVEDVMTVFTKYGI